jgi:hypothetical protein
MLIRHYWAGRGVVDFDPETGSVRRARDRSAAPETWGVAWRQRGRWFVLSHDGDSLVLQQRENRWPLTGDFEFAVSGGFRRSFQVRRSNALVFELSYWSWGALWSRVDPTYDGIDEEADDFFVYVCGMWNTERGRARRAGSECAEGDCEGR